MKHLLSASRRRVARACALAVAVVAACTAFTSAASAATGPYNVKWQEYGDLKDHVVYRPTNAPANLKMPVLIWGEGACVANGLIYQPFLTEIASHGILVIASGGPYQLGVTNVGYMDRSVDWAKKHNTTAGDAFAGKLQADRVVVAGHSCGGLEAYQLAAKRSEVAAVGIMNSGQLQQDAKQLAAIKAPVLYVLGGSGDPAYANGTRDYGKIDQSLPAVLANSGAGHLGTYGNANGGAYAQILKDWILYRINDDRTAAGTFLPGTCLLCSKPGWTVKSRNLS